MTTLPQIFNFHNQEVRTLLDDNGTPLFVAVDVAKALGYAEPSLAVRRLCKGGAKRTPLSTKGGQQELRVIYEPDVYRLVFGSKLKSAIEFQDWVFEQVLPQLRKTGSYSHNQEIGKECLEIVMPIACDVLGVEKDDWQNGISAMMGVDTINQLSVDQVAEAITHTFTHVVEKLQDNDQLIDFPQLENLPGHARIENQPHASLHDMVKRVAECYLDSEKAFLLITEKLEKDCKVHNWHWIDRQRLGTALRTLGKLSDEAYRHKQMLKEIDKNSLNTMSINHGLLTVKYVNGV